MKSVDISEEIPKSPVQWSQNEAGLRGEYTWRWTEAPSQQPGWVPISVTKETSDHSSLQEFSHMAVILDTME